MIKVDQNHCEIRGTVIELQAELTTVMREFLESGKFDKKDLELCVETACKSPDDIMKETVEMLHDIIKYFNED